MKLIKTIRSHTGHAQFLAECDCDKAGDLVIVREIPRPQDIPSPYSFSSTSLVYRWQGQEVIVIETAHKKFQVFSI